MSAGKVLEAALTIAEAVEGLPDDQLQSVWRIALLAMGKVDRFAWGESKPVPDLNGPVHTVQIRGQEPDKRNRHIFTEADVGKRVKTLSGNIGIITHFCSGTRSSYPVVVQEDCGDQLTYTSDGRYFFDDSETSLFLADPDERN